MAVDVHAHMVAVDFLDEVLEHPEAWPSVQLEQSEAGVRIKLPGEPWTRPIANKLLDMEARRDWMQKHGIHEQWVSGWMDLMGYGLSPEEGVLWSSLLNDTMAMAIKDHPELVGLASLPLQSPDHAARELGRAVEQLGFSGAMIATRVGERELDDPALEPFWQQAEALQAPIILHPGFTGHEPRLKDYGLSNAVGRASETTLAVSRLLMAGVLARHPHLRLVLVHGGGFLPFQLGRIRRAYQLQHGAEAGDQLDRQLQQIFYDSVLFEPAALEYLVRVAGPDHVVLGSDYPFPIGDLDPTRVVSSAPLEDTERQAIFEETAVRLKGGIRR